MLEGVEVVDTPNHRAMGHGLTTCVWADRGVVINF